ncbi:hypothetical protein V5735_19365 [Haladaptatus sp. SPP-AMP-3]|uniref:hypothetical protein n=1 Tax=Haladaptatus sp. SPP-AMP-3 TaxID=3121295 RepID=UPI003C2C1B07
MTQEKRNRTRISILAVVGMCLLASVTISTATAATASTQSQPEIPANTSADTVNVEVGSDFNWTVPMRLQDAYADKFSVGDGIATQSDVTTQASAFVSDNDDAYKNEDSGYIHLDSDIGGTWSNGWKVKYVADGTDFLSWPTGENIESVTLSSTATANGIEPNLDPGGGFFGVSNNVGKFDRTWDTNTLSQPRVAHEYVDLTASSSWSLTGVAIDTTAQLDYSWRSVELDTDMNAAP